MKIPHVRFKKDALSCRWKMAERLEQVAAKIRDAESPQQLKTAIAQLFIDLIRSKAILNYWIDHQIATRKRGRNDPGIRPYGILNPNYRPVTRQNEQTSR